MSEVGRPLPSPQGNDARATANAIRLALQGKINSTGTVTLAASAASTTVLNPFLGKGSKVFLFPQTAHASAEVGNGTIYIAPANYVEGTSFTITHANNAQTDRDFFYVILG